MITVSCSRSPGPAARFGLTNMRPVHTFDDYSAFLPRHNQFKQGHLHDRFMPADEVREKLDQIQGHLVWMPREFLKDAEMAEKGLQVNAYTESIYT